MIRIYLYVFAAIAIVALTWQVLAWRSDAHKLPEEIANHQADIKACNANGKINKGANDALLNNCTSALNKCSATLSLRSTCIPIKSTNAANSMASPQRGHDHTNASGLESVWLQHYESQCKLIQADYHACVAHDVQCVDRLNGNQ